MAKKKKHGGKREGAGRPEVKDKVVQFSFYVRHSRIKKIGKKSLKTKLLEFIEMLYENIKR